MSFQTVNPSTEEVIARHREHSLEEAREELERLAHGFRKWRNTPVTERAAVLREWADRLEKDRDVMSRQMALEMGKPITQACAEVAKCSSTLRYLAEHGPAWLESTPVKSPYRESWNRWEPLGTVLAIMPWNFPLWQVVRFAGPALLAGNVVILKHSELTAGVAEMIEASVPVPDGQPLLRNLRLSHEATSTLMAEPSIRGVTFTGSTRGGREVAARAGACLKKTVLELGGSDAYIVLADADLAKAAKVCAAARVGNAGQSCVAAKRFIVESSVHDRFLELFINEMETYQPMDPLSVESRLGPLAAKKFQEQLHTQVQQLIARGGIARLGCERPAGKGAFYPASVLSFEDANEAGCAIELFGPVASVFPVRDRREALAAANSSPYGLGSAVFSADVAAALEWSRGLEAGLVAINDQVRSDVSLSFGGVKDSGYGRELGAAGLHEFCNLQSVGVGPLS